MPRRLLRAAALTFGLLLAAPAAAGEASARQVEAYLRTHILPWLADAVVIGTLKAQNARHAGLTQPEIDALDKQWRAEVDAVSKPLIDSVMRNALSAFLIQKKAASHGIINEVFVMDAKGLNAGQSDITSDYWQGDEAKWLKTYPAGPGAVFLDKIEKDASTQTLQMQVSLAIRDPETGKALGAITLGINVDELSSS